MGAILSAGLMLQTLGLTLEGASVEAAVKQAVEQGIEHSGGASRAFSGRRANRAAILAAK